LGGGKGVFTKTGETPRLGGKKINPAQEAPAPSKISQTKIQKNPKTTTPTKIPTNEPHIYKSIHFPKVSRFEKKPRFPPKTPTKNHFEFPGGF